jgi:Fe-S cluster assembly protein SufD
LITHTLSDWAGLESPPIALCSDAPAWLQAWRAQQWQAFCRRGFPLRREESWRYTPLTDLLEKKFSVQADTKAQALIQGLNDAYRLVFINGVFSPGDSLLEGLPSGVILTTCREAIVRYPALYETMGLNGESTALSVFQWLNGAMAQDGLFLWTPDHCQLPKPIHVLYLTEVASEWMQHPRHMVRLGADSCASLLEEYRGINDVSYFTNVVTQISLQPNSRFHYCKLQREAPQAFHIANTWIDQAQDSQVCAHHLALGGRLHRDDLQFILGQQGAGCELSGFYYPRAHQLMDFHTRVDHQAVLTRSRQSYKGMIAAQGHGVFNGKIRIHPGAKRAAAAQSNHNWLLAESAEIDAKPELEVFADEVSCTHGATVGSLAPEALFYLRSRGVNEQTARYLLMRGFAEETLDQIADPQIAEYIRKPVLQVLATENGLEENPHEA